MLQGAMHSRLAASILRAPNRIRLTAATATATAVNTVPITTTAGATSNRFYSISLRLSEEAAAAVDTSKPKLDKEDLVILRKDYNDRRAAYKEQVKKLRKEYAREVAQHKEEDNADKERLQQEATRRRLERQRVKNIKSAQNMMRQEQKRLHQAVLFEQHVGKEKVKREQRLNDYRGAHQLAIQELEKEAPLWLSTPEEVEAAFTHEAEQLLWARPGGVLGAPNPSLDASFWQHQTHTWHMSKNYKLPRQILLEHLDDLIYDEANLDKAFWTPERLQKVIEKEEKARLRADVELVGRRTLLRKQIQKIEEQYTTSSATDGQGQGIPQEKPPPSLDFLKDKVAMETEGAQILMENPTRFFEFDKSRGKLAETNVDDENYYQSDKKNASSSTYSGQTLGTPVGLKKIGKNNFPIIIAKAPPQDNRSERERKHEERESRLLQAAREKQAQEMSIDLAATDQIAEDLEPDLDYSTVDYLDIKDHLDQQDEEAEDESEKLTPEQRQEFMNAPDAAMTYTPEDWEWAYARLREREEYYDSLLRIDVERLQTDSINDMEVAREKRLAEATEEEKADAAAESVDTDDDEGDDMETQMEQILFKLPYDQVMIVSDLDGEYEENPENVTESDIAKAVESIPSMTVEQLTWILQRNRSEE
mmetsp:Transcript_12999/g.17024  ORF Transcript_12999/g.17024 Transcript_12999/m.17024 type:complete len:649 (+) Transcript_12999:70-2016(+)|eukprot:CAMPEP_0198150584 /NCGR_PEP_ID=MMETSP1443-20131203/51553_1 /TAXON_ID=186043 /ORGANISM="Entomoneis sp., Strain CCMP2396" /LENGTH=648 /DNA_ID=CAMNT_0043815937 /DNA_START=57 /DNA_END=2003 /DNA_ORIENTATION=-